jgi:nucleotide-binding universal stress UspA family protein
MRILLAVDSSSHSDVAVHRLAERPWPQHSSVRILSVAQLYASADSSSFWDSGAAYEHLGEALLAGAHEVVERAANELEASTLSVETAVRRGDPRIVVVDEANEWKADLIVIGSHGRTGVRRWLLGSVAEHVVRHAPCSVEVCR